MLFGMLHYQIREQLFRHKVSTFDELLKHVREVEQDLSGRGAVNADEKIASGPEWGSKRGSFCQKKGHTMETCFKKRELNSQQVRNDPVVPKPKFSCYGCNAVNRLTSVHL